MIYDIYSIDYLNIRNTNLVRFVVLLVSQLCLTVTLLESLGMLPMCLHRNSDPNHIIVPIKCIPMCIVCH